MNGSAQQMGRGCRDACARERIGDPGTLGQTVEADPAQQPSDDPFTQPGQQPPDQQDN
jgi:hypothetical protein